MKSALLRCVIAPSALLISMASIPAHAIGDLSLFPTRVVFENNQRTADVGLINSSDKPVTYRLKLEHRRMDKNGILATIDQAGPDEHFADDLIRFSPRQVTLPPNGSQTVKIVVRKPADLADGEYRSHLVFERQPDASDTSLQSQVNPDSSGVQIKLIPLVGASIPVIVRQGATSATITINEITVTHEKSGDQLVFNMHRSGNSSVYGDLSGQLKTPDGKEKSVVMMSGVSIYTPNSERLIKTGVEANTHGHLHLVYREKPENGGKVLAEADADL